MNIAELFSAIAAIPSNKSYNSIDEFMADIENIKEEYSTNYDNFLESSYRLSVDDLKRCVKQTCYKETSTEADYKIKKFSKAEIEERTRLHNKALPIAKKVVTEAAINRKMFTKLLRQDIDYGANDRTPISIIANLCDNENECNDIIKAINDINGEYSKGTSNKVYLQTWYKNKLMGLEKHCEFFSKPRSDEEIVDYMADNFKQVYTFTELQGNAIFQTAEVFGFEVDQGFVSNWHDTCKFGLSFTMGTMAQFGSIASKYYPEFSVEDITYINNKIEKNKDNLDEDLQEKIGPALEDKTVYDGLTTYARNIYVTADYKFKKYDYTSMTNEAIADAKENKQKYVLNDGDKYGASQFVAQNVSDCLNYIYYKAGINPNSIIYGVNGQVQEPNNDESYNQIFNQGVMGGRMHAFINTPTGYEFFGSFSIDKNGFATPKFSNAPLKLNFLQAAKEVENNNDNIALTNSSIEADKSLKRSFNDMVNKLNSGSKWYISSKGDYGQVLNAMKELAKEENYRNRDELKTKIEGIKELTNNYFVNRMNKTDRGSTAMQREDIMETVNKTLETMLPMIDQLKELEANKSLQENDREPLFEKNDEEMIGFGKENTKEETKQFKKEEIEKEESVEKENTIDIN